MHFREIAFTLTDDLHNDDVFPYAILSHTWAAKHEEVTLMDLREDRAQSKPGCKKLRFCGEQAKKDKIEHFCMDTCCIDKANFTELSEAITSMYEWYRKAEKCYVYLDDVSSRRSNGKDETPKAWQQSFRESKWFTRGWTLQELLAPRVAEFYSQEGGFLGTKITLAEQIHEITTIPLAALYGAPLGQSSIAERMRWTEKRNTTKTEDKAYCLLGIFDVFIPLIYGEGNNAWRRLQKEIHERCVSNSQYVSRSFSFKVDRKPSCKWHQYGPLAHN